MAAEIKLKKKVDLPVWDWMRFAPVASSATSGMCCGEGRDERYLYYVSGTFWRYDTITDGWQQLASPPIGASVAASLRYSTYGGHRGNVLGTPSSTTMRLAGLDGKILKGYKIRITSGVGAGQERTITDVSTATIHEYGVVTTASANLLTDTTKKYKPNQYVGYQVRLLYGTGLSQVRNILYNDTNTLTFFDANFQQLDPWQNQPFSATAPYAAPVATAGSQAHFQVESHVITVDSPWDIDPDASSSYVILSGGVWYITSSTAAPWSVMQYYDILSDTWYAKTAIGGQALAAIGTDFSIERTGEVYGHYENGTATSGGTYSLTDSGKSWALDRWANYQVRITAGTGVGQKLRIVGNNATTLFLQKKWAVNPDATSVYKIFANTNNIYFGGNAASSLLKYHVEEDLWSNGSVYDYGIARQISAQFEGQEAFGITSITRAVNGITAVAAAPTAGGTGYLPGDILTVTTGGTNGRVFVETTTTAGAVATVSLYSAGTNYTTGAGKATSGGTGTGCTINISTVGTIGRVITATNHNLLIGDDVVISGCSDAAYNTSYTILCADALNAFDLAITAAASAVAATSIATTVLVDSTKNWTPGEHIGKIVNIYTAGSSPTMQSRYITANTATTLTWTLAATAPTNGTSRYNIQEKTAIGRATQYKVNNTGGVGFATGGSTTTLIDSTKNWRVNQWTGYKFKVISGTGFDQGEITILSNSATTLTYATQSFTPDATSKYLIQDTFGIATSGSTTTIVDTTKNWAVNQWAGKRVRILAGTGQSIEATIASNTATTLTTGTMAATIDTSSVYCILEMPPRGAGIELNWLFGTTDTATRGQKMLIPRGGGSNVFDYYNVSSELCEVPFYMQPQTEILTAGTMYAYDGEDRLYFQIGSTNRIFSLDTVKGQVHGAGIIPYGMSTAILGNRMEVVSTEDGLKYLYIMRHSATELWRTLIFWE